MKIKYVKRVLELVRGMRYIIHIACQDICHHVFILDYNLKDKLIRPIDIAFAMFLKCHNNIQQRKNTKLTSNWERQCFRLLYSQFHTSIYNQQNKSVSVSSSFLVIDGAATYSRRSRSFTSIASSHEEHLSTSKTRYPRVNLV